MSVNPSTPPVVWESGGVQYTTACYMVEPPPEPDWDGDGGGDGGEPVPAAGVDKFGVAKIFPDYPNPEYPAFYIDMVTKSNNSTRFNISYGSGSHIAYNLVNGNPSYYNSAGAVQHYASGNPDSRSCRFDIYPSEGMYGNNTNYSYKNNPGYLYRRNHFHNKEMTIYIRPHDQLGTHETFAFKVDGRDDDSIRSCIELVYPTATHHEVVCNVEYKHFPYVAWNKVRQYTSTSSTNILHEESWIGVKFVKIVADDKRSVWMGMWEDLQPFTSDGKPRNGWKLRADTVFTGVSDDDYDNIIPTWDAHKDTVRVDGFGNVDFLWYSDRPISKGLLSNPQALKPGSPYTYGTPPNIDYSQFDDPNI